MVKKANLKKSQKEKSIREKKLSKTITAFFLGNEKSL